ncbi:hypothetical protein Tco_0479082 [Tanacetum coccineum]
MEAHLAPKQPIQVNKITSSCEDLQWAPHDTAYCIVELIPEQAFVNMHSRGIDEAGGKQFTDEPKTKKLYEAPMHGKRSQLLTGHRRPTSHSQAHKRPVLQLLITSYQMKLEKALN